MTLDTGIERETLPSLTGRVVSGYEEAHAFFQAALVVLVGSLGLSVQLALLGSHVLLPLVISRTGLVVFAAATRTRAVAGARRDSHFIDLVNADLRIPT